MAGAQHRTESKLSLEIRTKSVEQTLIPLVTQVSARTFIVTGGAADLVFGRNFVQHLSFKVADGLSWFVSDEAIQD